LPFDVIWKHLPTDVIHTLQPTASRAAGTPSISAQGGLIAYGSLVEGLDNRFPDANGTYVFDRDS